MTYRELIQKCLDAYDKADASINCICGPEENDPECPWNLSEDALHTLKMDRAVAIISAEMPDLEERLENVG